MGLVREGGTFLHAGEDDIPYCKGQIMLSNAYTTELRVSRRGFLLFHAQECCIKTLLLIPVVPEPTIPRRCGLVSIRSMESKESQETLTI
jgi:hypothetical protein